MAATKERKSAYVCKFKGKSGYSGRGRPSFAFLRKQAKSPNLGKWKDRIPEYSGRGRVPHEFLVKHGFAEPKPDKPAPARQRRVPAIKRVSKWLGKPGYKGRGKPSHELLVKWGIAKPKPPTAGTKPWKDKPGYSGRGRPPAILLAQYKDRVEATTRKPPTPQPILDDNDALADIGKEIACEGAAMETGDLDKPDSELKYEMEEIHEIEKKAQEFDDIGNVRNARREWHRAAQRYEDLRLFSSAAFRFKMAWEWERAGHAYMNVREYKQAAEAFDKAKRQDLADKAYFMAGEKAEREGRYGVAALMFEKCGHAGVANKIKKRENALAAANSGASRRVIR